MPSRDESIESFGEATVFPRLDANCRYWQIEIDKADKDKTAFTSHHGLAHLIRMIFGLHNTPGTFQCTWVVIWSGAKYQFVLVYLDDIVVCSTTSQQHIDHVCKVLLQLHGLRITLKLKKSKLFTDNIDYLAHLIRQKRFELASHTTYVIHGLQPPTNLRKLQSDLGLCSVFC